jgi:hypothetical protein
VEQPALGVLGIAALALSALPGCVEIPASAPPSVAMTPAGQKNGDSRQIEISPPPDLHTNFEVAIVRLVVDVSPTTVTTCTGTLIAEDLVVTAHHCVARHDPSGRPVPEDVRPKDVAVELGITAMPWGEVGVSAIVTPDCGYDAGGEGGDIAILVLNRKLLGVATITPSPEPPRLTDSTTVFGFGVCAGEKWHGVELHERAGGVIEFQNRNQLWGTSTICPGDSGGPVFVVHTERQTGDRTLSLVGVVSTSVMSKQPGDDSYRFSKFTRIDAWPQILSAAQEIAHGATSSELPPYRSCAPQISTQAVQSSQKAKAH